MINHTSLNDTKDNELKDIERLCHCGESRFLVFRDHVILAQVHRTISVFIRVDTFHSTIAREKTSIINAVYTQPECV